MSDKPESKSTVIQIKRNGPYHVANLSVLLDSQGRQIETREVFSLCRCGGSKNKPFCDGDHKSNGFTDDKN